LGVFLYLLGLVVEDERLVAVGLEQLAEGFVVRMRPVGLQTLPRVKAQEESVGEALGEAFRADVRAPLEVLDDVDLAG
jgi:hypothetical protein